MRREMVTVVDSSAKDGDIFYVSGGKVGCQLELSTEDFFRSGDYMVADITRPKASA
jgi:prolyl-tRNA editing enzyme YbaK/EbsC (Cys-tRNA(Pro) deacylase)